MLKLTIKPGEFIDIGKDIRVVYSGGSNGNIHLLIDAPRELNIVRSKVLAKNSAAKAGDLVLILCGKKFKIGRASCRERV